MDLKMVLIIQLILIDREQLTVSTVYNDVFSGNDNDSNIHCYAGASEDDDYYRFETITFTYGTTDYTISPNGEEELVTSTDVNGNISYSSSFDWNDNGGDDDGDSLITFLDDDDGDSLITFLDDDDEDSWIHGWYDSNVDGDNNSNNSQTLPSLYWDII